MFSSVINAQEKSVAERANTLYVGYPAFIFDPPDIGFYLGYNLEIVKKDRFSWEGQASLSYSSFKRDDGIFAHDGGSTFVGGVLFGPRVYLMKSEKDVRLFFNFLPGLVMVIDQEYQRDNSIDRLNTDTSPAFGYSIGSYLQFNNTWIVGVSFEQYGSLVFKLGYKL